MAANGGVTKASTQPVIVLMGGESHEDQVCNRIRNGEFCPRCCGAFPLPAPDVSDMFLQKYLRRKPLNSKKPAADSVATIGDSREAPMRLARRVLSPECEIRGVFLRPSDLLSRYPKALRVAAMSVAGNCRPSAIARASLWAKTAIN